MVAQGCDKPWAIAVPTKLVGVDLREAVFGLYDPPFPEMILVCRVHEKSMRRDRVKLGYRKRHGQITAYVKEEYY